MNISGRANSALKNAALWAALGIATLVIALGGLGFMIAGFYIWLAQKLDHAAAAAITGGVLVLIALIGLALGGSFIRKSRKQYPSMLSELGGTVGLAGRLVGLLVRKDPKKALIISMIAGALAEYIASDRKKD